MEHPLKPTATSQPDSTRILLSESTADLTKICWTQLLRQTPELVGPQMPFEPLPDDFSPEKLFL